jgi:hypothetical protein
MFAKYAAAVAIAIAALSAALPYPNDGAVGVVWQFPNGTWIENLAVRQSGEILASSLSRFALYQVDPFSHTETTIAEFGNAGVLGIAEVENDVFVVVTAEVNLVTSVATPGSAKAWKVDMAAWSLVRQEQSARVVLMCRPLTGGTGSRKSSHACCKLVERRCARRCCRA